MNQAVQPQILTNTTITRWLKANRDSAAAMLAAFVGVGRMTPNSKRKNQNHRDDTFKVCRSLYTFWVAGTKNVGTRTCPDSRDIEKMYVSLTKRNWEKYDDISPTGWYVQTHDNGHCNSKIWCNGWVYRRRWKALLGTFLNILSSVIYINRFISPTHFSGSSLLQSFGEGYCHRQWLSTGSYHNLLGSTMAISIEPSHNLWWPAVAIDGYGARSLVVGNVYRLTSIAGPLPNTYWYIFYFIFPHPI